MSDLERRLAQDHALREAALGLFKADVALVREDLKHRGVGARAKERVGEAAMEVLDEAVDYADANRGKVATVVAAAVLWFARRPIIDLVADLLAQDEEPGGRDSRSDDE